MAREFVHKVSADACPYATKQVLRGIIKAAQEGRLVEISEDLYSQRVTLISSAGAFGPFSPILPVPVDDPGAPRPEPRRWQYPIGANMGTEEGGDGGE